MSASNYLENEILDHTLGTGSFTMPTAYVSLHTANPDEDASGTEVSGGSYARQTCAFDAASGGSASNTSDESFTNMPAATVTHFGIWDASTSGNMLLYGALDTSKTTTSGDTLSFTAGNLTITVE